MASQKFTLYDLPSKDKDCACWSLNPWKIRSALNYKGIEYETVWLEYPIIASTLKAFGIPPGQDPDTPYTIPACKFPGGAYAMDSKKIIKEIEERYPAPEYPSLHLDDSMTDRAYALTGDCWGKVYGIILPIIPRNVLNPLSAEYFWRTRKEWFGMSLGELEDQQGGEKAWETAKEPFTKVAETLKENEGPFFLGNTVSYSDFVFVSFMHFIHRAIGDEEFKRFEQWPEIMAQYKACEKWFERDTY